MATLEPIRPQEDAEGSVAIDRFIGEVGTGGGEIADLPLGPGNGELVDPDRDLKNQFQRVGLQEEKNENDHRKMEERGFEPPTF